MVTPRIHRGLVMDGPRACEESEFKEVISLINREFRNGTDQDMRTDYPLVFNPSRTEYMRIVKVDCKVVAHVPVAPREVVASDDRFTIGIISSTVTHPDYRRRGYATLCLRDCIRIMEDKGWPVSVLWTVVPTFPFYQHSDYEAVASQGWMYRLGPDEYKLFEANPFKVIRYDPAKAHHTAAIMRIHDAEPYRISRSRQDYQTLLSLPRINTDLAMQGRDIVAYLMLGEGANKPGLIEGGGSVEALEALVRYVLRERSSDREIQVLVPLTPTSLGQLLEHKMPGGKRPIEEANGVGHQMMRVNSLQKLVWRLKNHLRRKSTGLDGDVRLVCKETGEGITIEFRDGDVHFSAQQTPEQVVLTRRELARLIFGTHPTAEPLKCHGTAGEILETVFPYYFPIWELDHC